MKRTVIALTSATVAALVVLVAVPAGLASPPSISYLGDGSFTAPLTNVCTSPITLNGSFSNDTLSVFFNRNGNLSAIIDRFVEVDTFVGPTGTTLVGDPYHALTEVRFDSNGEVTSVSELAVLEKVTLPDATTALFAGRLDLITAPPGTFDFIPDTGHSSNLTGFCAALDAGQPLT
jgi:hypothetical protein